MYSQLKEDIITASQTIGIDKIGFASAAPFTHLKTSLEEQKAAGHTSGFEHPNIEERINPDMIFDQPQSIISIALAYPTRLTKKAESIPGERRGSFARASWGIDYHDILKERLGNLISFIQERCEDDETITFKPMVDTGELIDVAVAQRAGLGFIGKNGLLITEEFGSYVYLGEIITNIPFEPDTPIKSKCGDCTRCIDLCPTDALLGDGRMNAKRCLSYQTQTKDMMPLEYRDKIRTVIYGCDICQQVCPYNKGKDFHIHPEMEPDPESVTPLLTPMLTMSNKEFKSQFGALAGSWRGKKPLQRNAIIALANAKQTSAIPKLLEVIENDVRPVIRATAIWAVADLIPTNNPEILHYFKELQTNEKDTDMQNELQHAIQTIEAK
ncbi:tRNA epoxyqueuosine(34) reductase QueG [Vagococcus coleopterorum]|uniref:tRNA epoxyqueuosine(34) reductase QueG n=1 Tax=Vagococcus coleopterorum TaxID=2714946 RepID=A0A6G8AMT8_9ENTE|nr:tRNA epoxyqueuosine(34) reductase QueG [Vagococcus coleopterorum]QIL46317.1 tRNA epoxyqueuosine(34) reductase QueG [Vagococcus coleopterorum]